MKFYSIQNRGDMFSLQIDYDQVKFNLETAFSVTALSANEICDDINKKDLYLEAFQDNIDEKAKHTGFSFCNTLNGNMVSFPESMIQLSELEEYAVGLMDLVNLDSISITINAKSYSVDFPRHNFIHGCKLKYLKR